MSTENAKKRKSEDGEPGEEEESCGGAAAWEYSAPSIPTSHWIERGFDENYVEGMKVFLRRIQDRTCELRRGACRQDIVLGGSSGANNPVLLHDDALLPHWQEFANAMQLYQHAGASHRVFISNAQLPSSVMNLLTPALKDKPIEGFYLVNVDFGNVRAGIEFAIEIIQSNRKMEQFGSSNYSIESADDANHLVDAIICHPRINAICLENCFGEDVDAYEVLCSLLASNKRFSFIDLESNNIRTGGSTGIPDYLASNHSLRHLSLTNNHLDDNDATLIGRALKRNTNLRRLGLGQNDITAVGRDALRNAVFDSTSLNSVATSNHSCCIWDIGLDHINNEISSRVNRGSKVYRLLDSRHREGTNVQHLDAEFGDESLKLVPKVLEAVHHNAGYGLDHVGNVRSLSIMYEILRSWKMPILYENNKGSHIE